MASYGVSGAEEFVRLAANLKTADPVLQKAMLRQIRDAGKPIAHDMKAGIRAQLPNRGGLASRAAGAPIGIRTRAAGRQAGIRLQANGSKRSVTSKTLRSLDDSGSWRHPVWPDGDDRKSWKWTTQTAGAVKGWFTEPAQEAKPEIQRKVMEAMQETARHITRGI